MSDLAESSRDLLDALNHHLRAFECGLLTTRNENGEDTTQATIEVCRAQVKAAKRLHSGLERQATAGVALEGLAPVV